MKNLLISISLLLLFSMSYLKSSAQNLFDFLYVGTYNEKSKPGIFVFHFNRTDYSLKLIQSVGGMDSPSFLTIHPNGQFIYSVNRNTVISGKRWGSVSAYSIDRKSGILIHLNDQPTFGSESCHISIDSKGRLAFISNYSTGNVVVFPIVYDGKLGTITDAHQHTGKSIDMNRQKGPHAHCAMLSPDDRYLYVADLGIDKIKTYEIDYQIGKLLPIPESDGIMNPGAGPRHITFHQSGRFAYVIEELASSISVFYRNKNTGSLQMIQHIPTIPQDFTDTNYCADIHIDPSGQFLYGSNRGHDSLAIFKINQENGTLENIDYQSVYGKWPRNFLIDPKGEFVFVVNQNSDNLVIFKLNNKNGKLEKISDNTIIPKPVCVKIL